MTTAIVHVGARSRQLDDQLKSLAASSQAYLLYGRMARREGARRRRDASHNLL
jgi:hypothetical protein